MDSSDLSFEDKLIQDLINHDYEEQYMRLMMERQYQCYMCKLHLSWFIQWEQKQQRERQKQKEKKKY